MSSSSSSSLMSSSSLVPSSSCSPRVVPNPMTAFVVPEDTWEHRLAEPGEVLIDAGKREVFTNEVTQYLLLPTYANQDPKEGDIWIWAGQVRARVLGHTIPLVMGELDKWDVGKWDEPGRIWDGPCR